MKATQPARRAQADEPAYEGESVAMLFGTADRGAGLAAFRERRPPVFTGH
jgi:hypothetical protein